MTDGCAKLIHNKYSFNGLKCSKPPVVERDGKMYCKMHDPVAAKARRDASYAKWQAEFVRHSATIKFERAAQKAIEQIAEGHNDPRALAQSVMAMKPT